MMLMPGAQTETSCPRPHHTGQPPGAQRRMAGWQADLEGRRRTASAHAYIKSTVRSGVSKHFCEGPENKYFSLVGHTVSLAIT